MPPSSHVPARTGQLSFGHSALTRGQVIVTSARADTEGTVDFRWRRPMDMKVAVRTSRRAEMLELRNEVPQKMRVTYGSRTVRHWTSGGGHSEELPMVDGHTYVVDRGGGMVSAEREGRGDIGSGELEVIRDEFSVPMVEISVLHTLRGRTVGFGETIVVTDPEPPSGRLHNHVELTLVDTVTVEGRAVAVFDLRMHGGWPGSTYDLRGQARVDLKTARLLSYRGQGDVDVDDDGETLEGTMRVESTFEYPPARIARCRPLPSRRGCR